MTPGRRRQRRRYTQPTANQAGMRDVEDETQLERLCRGDGGLRGWVSLGRQEASCNAGVHAWPVSNETSAATAKARRRFGDCPAQT